MALAEASLETAVGVTGQGQVLPEKVVYKVPKT
jgi:hypothetical protein